MSFLAFSSKAAIFTWLKCGLYDLNVNNVCVLLQKVWSIHATDIEDVFVFINAISLELFRSFPWIIYAQIISLWMACLLRYLMNIALDICLDVWGLTQAGEYLFIRNQWLFYTSHSNIKHRSMASVNFLNFCF